MRMAYFAPVLSLLPLFFCGRKEASRELSFEWKILIWIGHCNFSSITKISFSLSATVDIVKPLVKHQKSRSLSKRRSWYWVYPIQHPGSVTADWQQKKSNLHYTLLRYYYYTITYYTFRDIRSYASQTFKENWKKKPTMLLVLWVSFFCLLRSGPKLNKACRMIWGRENYLFQAKWN